MGSLISLAEALPTNEKLIAKLLIARILKDDFNFIRKSLL